MKLWLITVVVACLLNLIALKTIGKDHKSNGLLRGSVFCGILAFWGIISTIYFYHHTHWLYHCCNSLSAVLTGLSISFAVISYRQSKKEALDDITNERQSIRRRVS